MATSLHQAHLDVLGTVTAVRHNDKAIALTLTGLLQLTAHSEFLQILNASATNYPVLPSAATLPIGWIVRFYNNGSATYPVKDFDSDDVVSIAPGECYSVFVRDNTTAGGTWSYIKETSGDVAPVPPYTATFNSTSNWTLNGGDYSFTVLASAHGKGIKPSPEIFKNVSGVLIDIRTVVNINAVGDVTFIVNALPSDGRFAGEVFIR